MVLGQATAQGYVADARGIAFQAARYLFVAKMLEDVHDAVEVGCGDAFGAPIVAQTVRDLTCTDIDPETLAQATADCKANNIGFQEWDWRFHPYPRNVDAIYAVDVIEHVYEAEEESWLRNIVGSLHEDGILILGTPNATAVTHAGDNSRKGHVNLKHWQQLDEIGHDYFRNHFLFGMNDTSIHVGFLPMAHYLFLLACGPKTENPPR